MKLLTFIAFCNETQHVGEYSLLAHKINSIENLGVSRNYKNARIILIHYEGKTFSLSFDVEAFNDFYEEYVDWVNTQNELQKSSGLSDSITETINTTICGSVQNYFDNLLKLSESVKNSEETLQKRTDLLCKQNEAMFSAMNLTVETFKQWIESIDAPTKDINDTYKRIAHVYESIEKVTILGDLK